MIQPLSRAYPSRYGAPILDRVSIDIFTRTYFMRCLECNFCNDGCCQHGVDVAVDETKRLDAQVNALSEYTHLARDQWFTESFEEDADFPGGTFTETKLGSRGCIFLKPNARACMIHAFCLERGIDYHELKPMICCIFPMTFNSGLLAPAIDVYDQSLICVDQGVSLYTGVRDELRYYFGDDLIVELDALAKS